MCVGRVFNPCVCVSKVQSQNAFGATLVVLGWARGQGGGCNYEVQSHPADSQLEGVEPAGMQHTASISPSSTFSSAVAHAHALASHVVGVCALGSSSSHVCAMVAAKRVFVASVCVVEVAETMHSKPFL